MMIDNRFVCKYSQYSFCGNFTCRLSKYCMQYPIIYKQNSENYYKNPIKKTAVEKKQHQYLYRVYNCLFGNLKEKNKERCKDYYYSHKLITDIPTIKPLQIYSIYCNQDCFNCIHKDCILKIPSDRSEYNKMYREANKEKLAQQKAKYRAEHREELNRKAKEYYQNNKTACLQRNSQYRSSHKDELKQYFKERNKQYKYKISKRNKPQNCYYSQYECCGWKNCPLYHQCSVNPITNNDITEPEQANKTEDEIRHHHILQKMYSRLFKI